MKAKLIIPCKIEERHFDYLITFPEGMDITLDDEIQAEIKYG